MFENAGLERFSIGVGADGSAVPAVDLGAPCSMLVLRCLDCTGIPADTTLKVQVGESEAAAVCDVHKMDGTGVLAFAMPAAGTWRAVAADALGARWVRLVLSKNVTGITAFEVLGIDAGV